jgi:hypothetical protein
VEDSKTNGPAIASAEALFQDAGFSGFAMDQIMTQPTGADFAPHFYVEGGLHPFGDVERKKRIQMIMAQYSFYGYNLDSGNVPPPGAGSGTGGPITSSDGGGDGGGSKDTGTPIISRLGVDIVSGMGEDTKAIANRTITSQDIGKPILWKNKRNRFGGVRAGIVGARFYTMSDSPPCYAMIGPWSFGLKPMRVGRA